MNDEFRVSLKIWKSCSSQEKASVFNTNAVSNLRGDPGNVLPADGRLEESHRAKLESTSKHDKLLQNLFLTLLELRKQFPSQMSQGRMLETARDLGKFESF